MILENDGSKNVTVTVLGPNATVFFSGYSGADPINLTLKARNNNEAGSCMGTLDTSWGIFWGNATAQSVCTDLNYSAGADTIGIDFAVTIPANNIPAGTYQNQSIVFTAAQS